MRFFLFWSAFCALWCCCGAACAAPTGYTDDFAVANLGKWAANPGYKVSQADGIVTLQVNKVTMWAGQKMSLGDSYDFSAHPYLNVTLKTSAPMIMDAYLVGINAAGKGVAFNIAHRIRLVDDFQTYCFDFSKTNNIDAHAITELIFCVNGSATSWDGVIQLKHLRVGDQATLLPAVEAMEDQQWYHDSGTHTARIMGLEHVQRLSVTGAEKLIRNVTFSNIEPTGRCTMSFDVMPGATGAAPATLSAVGEDGYGTSTRTFNVFIEGNLPPTIDHHDLIVTQAGKPCTTRFTGVSCGNTTANLPLTITVASSNPAVLAPADIVTDNPYHGHYLLLSATPRKAGDTTLTITLDNKSGANTTSTQLQVHAVKRWNTPPTLDAINDQQAFINSGDNQLTLTGVSDGDGGKDGLTFSAESADAALLPTPTIAYAGGNTAILHYTPTATAGVVKVTVTVKDHGGRPDNNGDQAVSRTFTLVTRVRPVKAYTANLADMAALLPNLRAEDAVSVAADTDNGAPVLKISCKDKPTFGGLWLKLPAMDLTDAPCLSVDVKASQPIAFNMYFWDGNMKRNDGANRATGIGTDWQTVTFDFSGNKQMNTGNGIPIDRTWITSELFNFHPTFAWPFSNWTGTLYLRNLRIGTAADVPVKKPVVTIAPVADQVYAVGSGIQQVALTGLASSNHQNVTVTVSANGLAQTAPTVGPLTHGTAMLTLTVGAAGRDTITVTATAPDAVPATITFTIDVLDLTTPTSVTIDTTKRCKTIRGLGAADIVLPNDLGASTTRLIIGNEIDPIKDTSDLNVLNHSRMNYQAIDAEHIKAMQAAGVESFFATIFTPPAWQKTNFSVNWQSAASFADCDQCANRLDYDCYDDFAKAMVMLVRMIQEETGVTLDAVSLQNEPAFCEQYDSAILDPKHNVELIKVVGRRFAREGITTRIAMSEQVVAQWGSMLDYINTLLRDPEAQKYCPFVAMHNGDVNGIAAQNPDIAHYKQMFDLAQTGVGPKEMWMTEINPDYANWKSAMDYSLSLYDALEFGNLSLWCQGSYQTFYHQNTPTGSYWAARQYFKFIRPGAVRLTNQSGARTVLVTAYQNDAKHGGKLVAVLTNTSDKQAAVLRLTVPNHPVAGWQVITSDAIRQNSVMKDVNADGILLLQPNSVTTVIEK